MRMGVVERILPGGAAVHLEQIAVTLAQGGCAQPTERLGEVQVDRPSGRANAPPASHTATVAREAEIARAEVAVARIEPFEEVVPVSLGDERGRSGVARRSGTHSRPSLRRDSDIKVSLAWCASAAGRQVG